MNQNSPNRFLGIDMREGVRGYSFFLVFLMGIIINILNTVPGIVLPAFFQEVIGIDRKHAGQINTTIAVIVEITAVLFVGIVGVISDKVGRKILLLLGLVCAAFCLLMFQYHGFWGQVLGINQLAIIYFIRWLLGLSLLFAYPQIASLLTDYTFVHNRGKAMAIMGFAFTIGAFITFSSFSRLPKLIGIYNVFTLTCFICLFGALITILGITNLQERSARKKIEWKKLFEHIRKSPGLKLTYTAAFATRADVIILGMFIMIWVVKVAGDFGKTTMQAVAEGGIIVAISSGLGLISYPLWGILVEKWGRLPTLALGLAFSGIGYTLIGFIHNPFSIELKLCIIIFALGVHALGVGASTLTSDLAPRHMIGSVLGGYNTCASLGVIVFLQVGGYLFDHKGHAFPFLFSGLANLSVFLLAIIFWKSIRADEASAKKKDLVEIKMPVPAKEVL